MTKEYNNEFKTTTQFNSICFSNDILDIKVNYELKLRNKIKSLGFFLANIFAYEYDEKFIKKGVRVFNVSKDDDIYLINSIQGSGIIFEIQNGIEIFCKESRKNITKKYHYQFITEELANDEKLLKVINCQNRTIVECYLVDSNFVLNDANNEKIGGKGFKPLFKTK